MYVSFFVYARQTYHNPGLPTCSRFRFPPFALYTTNGRYRIVHPVGMRWCGHVVYPRCVDRFASTVVVDLPGCALSALRLVHILTFMILPSTPPSPTARHASRQSVQQKRFVHIHIHRSPFIYSLTSLHPHTHQRKARRIFSKAAISFGQASSLDTRALCLVGTHGVHSESLVKK